MTLQDYANGFAGDELAGQMELQKAMQAGQITGRDTTNQALTMEPLKAESLEKTLKLLEFRTQDIKLWNAIPKLTAYNTVEEFLQLVSYGTQRGGFYGEGELSDVEDSVYTRRAEKVKYMQVTGEVTMQAQMVNSFVDAMRKEVENKMMWILRLANNSLTKADSDIVSHEFNSFYKQHASIGVGTDFLYATFEDYYNQDIVIDLRGASIKQADVEQGAVVGDLHFCTVDTLFAPTTVISALARDYYNDQRILLNGDSAFRGVIGTVPKTIATTMGDIALMTDKGMQADPAKTLANSSTSTKAPAAPASVAVSAVSDTTSKYTSGEAGNVFYAVSALNSKGESNLTSHNSSVAVSAAHATDITITAGNNGNTASGYVIYRTKVTTASSPTGLTFYPIFKVSTAQVTAGYNGASAGVVRDRGYFLPDTEQCFMTQMAEEVMSFKQLAPISKLDLAIQKMARSFICFLFGTPQLYAPKKMIRFINVSKVLTA